MKPETDGPHAAGKGAFEDVLARLRQEAADLEAETYPGDLNADIRSRLGPASAGSWITGSRWLLVTAAAASLLAIIVTHQGPSLSSPPRRSPRSPMTLSRLAKLPSAASAPVPLSLLPRPTGFGRAFSIGSAAMARVRPPARPEMNKEER